MPKEKYEPVALDYQASLNNAVQRECFEAFLDAVPDVEVGLETDRIG
jgi:hypothetical protein